MGGDGFANMIQSRRDFTHRPEGCVIQSRGRREGWLCRENWKVCITPVLHDDIELFCILITAFIV